MADYKKYILLIVILITSGFYCFYFFNGYLGLSDGNDYAGLARSIIRGEGFSLGHLYPLAFSFGSDIPRPNNLWPPAYPVYLAIWFLLFGMSDTTILGAIVFSVWLFIMAVYFVIRKIAGADWAILGAALIGLNQSMLSTALEGSPEPLTAALFLFSLYPLVSGATISKTMLSAFLFGLAVLTRYQMIALAIPVLIFLVDRRSKMMISWAAVMLLVLSPWLIRNYVVFGNPIFTLQAYGEFTKSMGHLGYYYYTYRSFTPMSFAYAVTHFPFFVFKKFVAGILFFSWWTIIVLNFFSAVPFVFAVIWRKYLGSLQKRFIGFGVTSLILLIALSSFNGIHLRHLLNVQGVLVVLVVLGLIRFRENMPVLRKRYLWILAILFLLLPFRFPFPEMELKRYADRIDNNKEAYKVIMEKTEPGAVIISDASDAVWWYCNRSSIWIPVIYGDLKTLLEIQDADYIYFENSPDYLGRLKNDELLDFMRTTSIVEGNPLGWSLYKINR
ncbi:MAG: glycosyltransferase family 39 protein [Candidatus Zixiibacteriota bacterium]|nr:MAG: glycosyltransferase family 39 protein [candidate division Zixibacteria bacterium]